MGAVYYRWWNRVLLAAAAVGVLSGVPRPANAQLRSLHAVRYIKLDPPTPHAANLHRQLTAWLQLYLRLVESPESLPAEEPKWSWSEPGPRSRFAHCALRTDLSAPQKIGLECSDYAGHYIGTVRFADEGELRRWVDELVFNQPVARPLSAVRSIFVGPISGDRHNIVEYVRELLRASAAFNILDSDENLSDEAKDDLVWCEINPFWGGSGDYSHSRLRLKDRFGRTVRNFEGSTSRVRANFAAGSALRQAISEAVQKLLEARRKDEQTYGARTTTPK